jgi:hypothetical protein
MNVLFRVHGGGGRCPCVFVSSKRSVCARFIVSTNHSVVFDGSNLFVPYRTWLCGSYAARGRLEEAVKLLEHARAMYVAVPVVYLREDAALVAPRTARRYPCARSQEGSQCCCRDSYCRL